MKTLTQKFIGGSVKTVLIADDFEFNGLGAPASASTLLELVNTNGTTITVLGWYFWSGTAWQLFSTSANGAQYPSAITLAQSAVAASVTGTLTETVLASITIPGGMMGPNGALRISALDTRTSSANNKTVKVKLGAMAGYNSTLGAGVVGVSQITTIRNRNSVSAQVVLGASIAGTGSSAAGPVTGSIDTSVDQVLTITGTLTNVGETITLEGYTVEVLPG